MRREAVSVKLKTSSCRLHTICLWCRNSQRLPAWLRLFLWVSPSEAAVITFTAIRQGQLFTCRPAGKTWTPEQTAHGDAWQPRRRPRQISRPVVQMQFSARFYGVWLVQPKPLPGDIFERSESSSKMSKRRIHKRKFNIKPPEAEIQLSFSPSYSLSSQNTWSHVSHNATQ